MWRCGYLSEMLSSLQAHAQKWTVGSHDSFIFHFLRNCLLFSVMATLVYTATNSENIKGSLSPHSHHRLLASVFLIIVILTGLKRCLIMALMCISLIRDVEHISCTYWPLVCLWKNVVSGPLSIVE